MEGEVASLVVTYVADTACSLFAVAILSDTPMYCVETAIKISRNFLHHQVALLPGLILKTSYSMSQIYRNFSFVQYQRIIAYCMCAS